MTLKWNKSLGAAFKDWKQQQKMEAVLRRTLFSGLNDCNLKDKDIYDLRQDKPGQESCCPGARQFVGCW